MFKECVPFRSLFGKGMHRMRVCVCVCVCAQVVKGSEFRVCVYLILFGFACREFVCLSDNQCGMCFRPPRLCFGPNRPVWLKFEAFTGSLKHGAKNSTRIRIIELGIQSLKLFLWLLMIATSYCQQRVGSTAIAVGSSHAARDSSTSSWGGLHQGLKCTVGG